MKVFIFYTIVLCYASYLFGQGTLPDKEFSFAEQLYQDKLYTLAGEQFNDFARKFPSHEKADDALFLSGESYFNATDYRKAFDAYKQLEIRYPQSTFLAQGRFRLAECQAGLENYAAAAELFKRVPVFHKDSDKGSLALIEAANAYLKIDHNKAALSALYDLIGLYPESTIRLNAHLKIVAIYFNLGNYNEALQQTDNVFRIYGADLDDPRIFLFKAQILEKLGQTDAAIDSYTKTVQTFSTSEEAGKAALFLGNLYQAQGQHTKAREYYQIALDKSGSSEFRRDIFAKMGDFHFQNKEFEQALEHYQSAFELANGTLKNDLQYKIASTLFLLGLYEAAEQNLIEIINNVPQDSTDFIEDSYIKLIEVAAKLGHTKVALQTMSNYKEKFGNHSKAEKVYFKGAHLFENRLQNYTRALRAYQEFVDLFPRSPRIDDAYLGIGRCYEKLGDYKLASHEYGKYLESYPGADEYQWAKARLKAITGLIYLNNQKGIDEISILLGKIASEKSKTTLNHELARFYFEIKDFARAIKVCKGIIESATNGIDRSDIYYLMGLSYYKTAQKKRLMDAMTDNQTYLDSASIYLERVAVENAKFHNLEETEFLLAAIEMDSIKTQTKKEAKLLELFTTWNEKYPNGLFLDDISIQIADFYFKKGLQKDTTSLKTALTYFSKIKENHPKSEFFEQSSFRMAQTFNALGQDSLAFVEIEGYLKSYPGGEYAPNAHLLKAILKRKLGSMDSAMTELKSIMSNYFYSPVALQAQVELANINYEDGNYRSALEILQTLELSGGMDFLDGDSLAYRKAVTIEKLGHYSKALDAYIKLINENPESHLRVDASFAVARLAHAQGKTSFARDYYNTLLTHASEDTYKFQANIALGDIFFEEGLYNNAHQHYLAAIPLAKGLNRSRYPESQAIRCLIKLKRFQEAETVSKAFKKKFDETKKEEAQFLLDHANTYLDSKEFELAEKAFKKLKDDYRDIDDFEAQGEFGLGAVYLVSKHTEDALKVLTAIPSKYPDSEVAALTFYNLGDFYYKSQQIENAISAFREVLNHPKSGNYKKNAHLYLIQCYKDLRLWDQAIVTVRAFLEEYPHSEQSFRKKIDLAQFLMNLKEYDRAISDFRKLLPFADPESEAEIQFYIAQSYREMGDFERAASEYLKVKYLTKPSKLPWHVTALFEAGRVLQRLNEVEAAIKVFRQIIKEHGSESNFGRFALKQLEEIEKEQNRLSLKNGNQRK